MPSNYRMVFLGNVFEILKIKELMLLIQKSYGAMLGVFLLDYSLVYLVSD